MSVRSVRRFLAMAPMAAAAVLALAAPMSASALQVTYNDLTATGTYSLDNGPVINVLPWLDTAVAKDVLAFPHATGSFLRGAVLHSYGDTSGSFGSRSSGTGIYDVTGSFSITLTLTNDEGAARAVGFDYYITPGQLNLESFYYGAGQFAQTSTAFDISVNGAPVWNSGLSLRADETHQTGIVTQTGENIYSGSGQNYNVVGGQHHLDLGVLEAGESLSLTYKLSSAASGNAISESSSVLVPGWTEVIPEHWIEYVDCSGSYGGEIASIALFSDAAVEEPVSEELPAGCTLVRELVPEQIIVHDPIEIGVGDTGGSHSSSGDPFALGLNGNETLVADPNAAGFGFTSVATGGAVPEPGALSLVALALAGAGVARRRRN